MYGDFELSMLVIGDPSEEGLCNNNKIINVITGHKIGIFVLVIAN